MFGSIAMPFQLECVIKQTAEERINNGQFVTQKSLRKESEKW
jgi:hypothetical protein